MRDHYFNINHNKLFPKWREYSQIYYDIWTDDVQKKYQVTFPKKYTQCIQQHKQGFHIPFGEYKENMKVVSYTACLFNNSCFRHSCEIV